MAVNVVEWRSERFPGMTQWIVVDEAGVSWGAAGSLEAALVWIFQVMSEREAR